MPDLDPATVFAPRFNALGAPWATTGSIASTLCGEFRSTNDIDIIVLLDGRAAEELPHVFPETEFYCPPLDVIEIERGREQRGHFNLVHHDTGWKADVFLSSTDPLQAWALRNRRAVENEGANLVGAAGIRGHQETRISAGRRQRKASARYSRDACVEKCGPCIFGKGNRPARSYRSLAKVCLI